MRAFVGVTSAAVPEFIRNVARIVSLPNECGSFNGGVIQLCVVV